MADGKTPTNLQDQAPPTAPVPAQTLSSEAVLDALKMILLGAPLNEVLTSVTHLIEAHSRGMLCSIFLLDEDGSHLRYAAAANLPETYRAATDGVCIGPNVGSCGAAAYLRQPVFVSDIVSHPNWANFRGVVLQSGLRAAWSTPIMSHDGKVLGTFCMYYREVRHPGPGEIQLLDYASRIAGIAIERDRSQSALTLAFEKIKTNEQSLRLIVDGIPGFVITANAAGEVELVNRQVLEYFGKTAEEFKNWATSDAVHPEDLPRVIDAWRRSVETGQPPLLEYRQRRADGVYRWFQARGFPARDTEGRITGWYTLLTDIDDRKRAEEKLRQDERELRQLIDFLPQHVLVLDTEGFLLQANRMMLDYNGHTLEEMQGAGTDERIKRDVHPDDLERTRSERRCGFSSGVPFEIEKRMLGKDGRYRWFLFRYRPLLNEQGRVARWFATATDIEDRKQTEQSVRNENLALREEIDRSSMYEAIVGSSEALRRVISQISKVAPTDSTVLISGETGTGKELIASAIHKRSKRSARAFIRVNCAAIPTSLIASELFGHEKGAFTGAIQRRAGRFESADGGTIFLDEIGELSLETQIALLRVLQEREFERVGSSQPISIDVRVLAATNRDLEAAVAAGTFRQDLFYRLNVFPVRVPSLRERKDDIPLLVEYLVERYAKRAGKRIRHIKKKTLDLFQAYDWPGNIRELQNVIERAVILCDGDAFSVDETWLQWKSNQRAGRLVSRVGVLADDKKEFADRERKAIEAVLTECHGRVSGPHGAAAKLGIPHQTLESKIASLGIDKGRFKVWPSRRASA